MEQKKRKVPSNVENRHRHHHHKYGTMLCRMGLEMHTRGINTRFQALTHAVFVMRASSNASDIEAMRRISIRLFAGRRTLRQVRAETFRFGWCVACQMADEEGEDRISKQQGHSSN